MRAYGTAGGGVMFVPDEIDTIPSKKLSAEIAAKKILKQAAKKEKAFGLFNRRRKSDEAARRAA